MLAPELPPSIPPPSHDSKTMAAWGAVTTLAARRRSTKWIMAAAVLVLPLVGVIGARTCSPGHTAGLASSVIPASPPGASSASQVTPPAKEVIGSVASAPLPDQG